MINQQNSALVDANDTLSKSQSFVEKWLGDVGSHNVIIQYSDSSLAELARIPVIVGGNIAGAPFMYIYTVDLPNLPNNATVITGTAIIPSSSEYFNFEVNKDGGNPKKLRLKFNNLKPNGVHVFMSVMKKGGKILADQ